MVHCEISNNVTARRTKVNEKCGIITNKQKIALLNSKADPIYIFKLILESYNVSSIFKENLITPLHKNGAKTTPGNFSPMSKINNVAKLFE